jgi:NADH-quinone oxidoreductase subunit I
MESNYNLSKKKKVITNPKMSFLESLYLPAIFQGMAITMSHFFKRKATVQYPEQKRPIADVYRGLHVLKRDENGAERCTSCGLCALSCPAEAITMVAAERKDDEKHLYREEKYAETYEINMLRCIFCGLCEEACPKEAIFLTNEIVMPEYMRKDFVYGKDILLEPLQIDQRIDVSLRQTEEVLDFKHIPGTKHNTLFESNEKN